MEEIIPGLDLSLSDRNSYNYCGSIRLKKIFREREREGMHIIIRNSNSTMLARARRTETELRRSQCCGCLLSVWFKKKTAGQANILFRLFLTGCLSFSFGSHQTQKHLSSSVTPKARRHSLQSLQQLGAKK